MSEVIEGLFRNIEQRRFTRREVIVALGAAAIAPRVMAQGTPTPIKFRRLNSATMAVSDVKRSTDFYQSLFGMPIQAKQGETVILRLGTGPQFLALTPAKGNPTGIISFGLTVEDYDAQKLKATLDAFGVKDARVVMRGPDLGGAPTPEVFFTDSNGFDVQLQPPTYGGGGGVNGDQLLPISKPASRPPIPLVAYSHMTFGGERAFYEKVFGMSTQAFQGPVAILKVGTGPDFLTGMAANPPKPGAPKPMVGHICVTMEGYDPNMVTGILMKNGVEPVEFGGAPATVKAMTVRTRLRQRAGNGGGPTHPLGSYETYMRDPDNIETQIQDVSYCGGSGANGQICP